ncbi:MAG: glutamine amidotransferase [Clostridiales bacterium]|nr:glutamine amidotransferase [Clostridiales bacterium]
MKTDLHICHLYSDLLNLYGDRGNILALIYRAGLRGIDVRVTSLTIGEEFDGDHYDIVFFGGGQDAEQNIIRRDLVRNKGDAVKAAIEKGKIFLCVCGGYQMMGKYYEEFDGNRIECLAALDVYTVAQKKRLIGNTVYRSDLSEKSAAQGCFEPGKLYGFENHSGRTFLGDGVKPLAKVLTGAGNNGEDGTEGAVYRGVYCTYSHGSLLPKNPAMTDVLLEKAMKQRFGDDYQLAPVSCEIENIARRQRETCKKGLTNP